MSALSEPAIENGGDPSFPTSQMKDWFMIDPVLSRVENNAAVDGVRAEVAEALRTADGLVIWRISGLDQRAETAAELEDGRLQKMTSVNIGTLKFDPEPKGDHCQ